MRSTLLLALVLVACGDPSPAIDGGTDAFRACTSDDECDDGTFCNGAERCDPDREGADARGCVTGRAPCSALQVCDEDRESCATDCLATRDADQDGARAVECGGDDCDDAYPEAFPGATEVCDPDDRDEDCDPTTFGERDADDDGFFDGACCNGSTCGDDCDDGRAAVRPDAVEVCDERDQDCDALVDETVTITFVIDADRDGHGDAREGAETRRACSAPIGFARAADDCDDDEGSIHPGAYDACEGEGVDDDCSGAPDDPPAGCACADGASRTCPLPGSCAASNQTCVDGVWGACGVPPRDEICGNDLDEDCDGAPDDGCTCDVGFRACGSDEGVCTRGIQSCAGDSWGACVGEVGPAPETCDGEDDDCDGDVDEGTTVQCYADGDRDGFAPPSAFAMSRCGPTCPAGTTSLAPSSATTTDCDDLDARAFPGQTGAFGDPRSGVGGFDFDCDGVTEAGRNNAGCLTNATGDGCVYGRSYSGSEFSCGQYVAWQDCAFYDGECRDAGGCTPGIGTNCERYACR
ncbi:putative metal-binding motif-containing protein [Sandaracinus amylolyticus]|uniref:putative metal-binding motif-containing protein n=1 Tax=Sandaracinus amylolyticus TaxID=927083 RepID=UPI001F43BDA3|nr:putative metal-binding motif-containing protein [Sandaracinus amylolyticus]UJR78487.1 BNR repeat domain protein [Sandaracinus amylolyticus]